MKFISTSGSSNAGADERGPEHRTENVPCTVTEPREKWRRKKDHLETYAKGGGAKKVTRG